MSFLFVVKLTYSPFNRTFHLTKSQVGQSASEAPVRHHVRPVQLLPPHGQHQAHPQALDPQKKNQQVNGNTDDDDTFDLLEFNLYNIV